LRDLLSLQVCGGCCGSLNILFYYLDVY
jgi:hypothetical protein